MLVFFRKFIYVFFHVLYKNTFQGFSHLNSTTDSVTEQYLENLSTNNSYSQSGDQMCLFYPGANVDTVTRCQQESSASVAWK